MRLLNFFSPKNSSKKYNFSPVFYDIETTGLSRKSTFLYLIGAVGIEDETGIFTNGWPKVTKKKKQFWEFFSVNFFNNGFVDFLQTESDLTNPIWKQDTKNTESLLLWAQNVPGFISDSLKPLKTLCVSLLWNSYVWKNFSESKTEFIMGKNAFSFIKIFLKTRYIMVEEILCHNPKMLGPKRIFWDAKLSAFMIPSMRLHMRNRWWKSDSGN